MNEPGYHVGKMLYCIDNQFNSKRKVRLTVGNWYEVIRQQHFEIIVRNDTGRMASYDLSKYFATKQELRDILNELLS